MRKRLLFAGEAVGVGITTAGVALWSVPAALVLLGGAIVAACEVRG
jgi:cytochrome c-type biogenesis protein CcmH/NrfF